MSLDFSQFLVFDALVAAGVLVASIVFVFTFGKHSVVPMLAALGLGTAFSALAPVVNHVPGINNWLPYQQHVLVFAVITLVAYFIFRRHIYFEPSVTPSSFEAVFLGVLIGGFILAVIGSFLPAEFIATLTPQVRMIFVDDVVRSIWLASPMIGFVVMKGKG